MAFSPPPLEAIILATCVRRVPGVVKLLLPDAKLEWSEQKEDLKEAVLANTAQLFDLIPKDVEFTYNQKIDLLKPFLQNDAYIP